MTETYHAACRRNQHAPVAKGSMFAGSEVEGLRPPGAKPLHRNLIQGNALTASADIQRRELSSAPDAED